MTWRVGDVVGGYRIESLLGIGGFGAVYLATHVRLGRQVAIKALHANHITNEEFLARFEREARIVAALEHPNITPVYDFDEVNNSPYLVSKYIEGETLKERMRHAGPTPAEIIDMMDAIASALDYAHEQGVLHRDVKANNVMLDTDGTPYLMDFGLARIMASGDSSLSVNMIIGTPNYMAPELVVGDGPQTASADIYSLGVMLYEMVVGRVPFEGETAYATLHKQVNEAPPLPSDLNPEVPVQVEQVLLRALEKDPAQRYATASELAAAFKTAVQQSGLEALSPERSSVFATRTQPPSATAIVPQPGKPKRELADSSDVMLLLDGEESYGNLPQTEIVRRRLAKRQGEMFGFVMHALAYIVVNTIIISSSAADGDFGPNAFITAFAWGAGLAAHGVHFALQTKRSIQRLYRRFNAFMQDAYSPDWRAVVAPAEIDAQWHRAKKRAQEWEGFWAHAAVYAMINIMFWVIWSDDVAETGQIEFMWPLIVNLAWGVGLVSHGLVTRYGKGSRASDAGIDAELAMMQNLGSSQVKRKHLERESVRLTEDGEFTESMVTELEDERRQARR